MYPASLDAPTSVTFTTFSSDSFKEKTGKSSDTTKMWSWLSGGVGDAASLN